MKKSVHTSQKYHLAICNTQHGNDVRLVMIWQIATELKKISFIFLRIIFVYTAVILSFTNTAQLLITNCKWFYYENKSFR